MALMASITTGRIMANTTDLMITTYFNKSFIKELNEITGLEFKLISDGGKCGGDKVVSFSTYAACWRCIGEEKIIELIRTFRAIKARDEYVYFGEYIRLLINCDNKEEYNGVYK